MNFDAVFAFESIRLHALVPKSFIGTYPVLVFGIG